MARGLFTTGANRFATTIVSENDLSEDNLIAYKWEGKPLTILHGFAVRIAIPDAQGSAWVKWLEQIEVR